MPPRAPESVQLSRGGLPRAPPAVPRLATTSELQVFPQPFRLRPADRNLRALRVLHPEDVVPAEPRDNLLDLVDVDQMRPMHSPERVRVETGLQLVKGPVVGCSRYLPRYYVNRLV